MVYLLHFERPYRHARHYTGSTDDLTARLGAHRAGQGARLLAVIRAAGIGWDLARTWPGGRVRERQLKRQGGASLPVVRHHRAHPGGWAAMSADLNAKAAQLAALDEGQRRAARLVVCAHARDVADAAQLLDALGLGPPPAADSHSTEAHR